MPAPAEMGVAALHARFPVICDGPRDDLVERREAHLAEIAKRAARVEQDAGRVIRANRADLRLGVFVDLHRPHDLVVELFDGDVASGREMIGAAAGAVRRLYHSTGEVMHKHEIAARLGDKTPLPLRQPVEKDRQWTADIARPDDIGEPKRNPIDTAILNVMLARGFRNRIAAVDGINRVVERDWLLAR